MQCTLFASDVILSSSRVLSPVRTSNKVEFNMVDFVESRPCCFGNIGDEVDGIGNKVERIGNNVETS